MAGRFSIDAIDIGPDDLTAQLPLTGRLRRMLPGPDRPDYVLAELDRPVTHRTTIDVAAGVDLTRVDSALVRVADGGALMISTPILVLAARMVGQQVHQGMVRFPVNIAYALSGSLPAAERLEFALCLPVAVGFITDRDGDAPPAA